MTQIVLDPAKQPWLSDPKVLRLLAALPGGSARFVGGCVRDALWGESVGDIDIAVTLEPKDVVTALKADNIKTVPTGIDHGTVTAILDGTPFEITSLRKDVETDGRRAVVAFTQDWAEDAQRRDLTVNALYADQNGTIYDPCGQGLNDIAARRFRFVGDADMRVREDYLRILRLFRFIAWYGGTAKIDASALKACRENRQGLKTLSAERVWSETKKLLAAPDPVRAVRIMLTNEVLDKVLPEASNVDGLALLTALESRETIGVDPLLRLMAMSARDEFALAGLAKRLKLSKAEKLRLLAWAEDRTPISPDMDERARKIAAYTAGSQTLFDRAIIRAAGTEDALIAARWTALAQFAKSWTVPEFPLKGRDLKAAGVADGPRMGKTLEALKALWVRSGFEADKDRLLMALSLING